MSLRCPTMQAVVRAIEYELPEATLTNADLAAQFPEWRIDRTFAKTGIERRHIAGPEECASDLAVRAAAKLLSGGAVAAGEVDFLLLCTQSPDYFLPTTACLVQDRLGLPTSAGALDINLGHSGFVYGLGLAKGLIETGQARNVLFITAETYSKYLHPEDRATRPIFGDAAAATLIRGIDEPCGPAGPRVGPFLYGTDGRGAENLIVRAGGARRPRSPESSRAARDEAGNLRVDDRLYMNGPELFAFTLREVGPAVQRLMARSDTAIDSIDLFVFHQANRFMLEHLRSQLGIPEEKFVLALADCGNTVSSSIPIALKEAQAVGALRDGHRVLMIGFGVGYSWAGALLRWSPEVL
jgi:3-oxoacyl-[acyl-carrier-protein] synthase-3